jgi:hypothetical protein
LLARDRFSNLDVVKLIPFHLSDPTRRKKGDPPKVKRAHLKLNRHVASIRAFNEIGNSHLKICRTFQHKLPRSLFALTWELDMIFCYCICKHEVLCHSSCNKQRACCLRMIVMLLGHLTNTTECAMLPSRLAELMGKKVFFAIS